MSAPKSIQAASLSPSDFQHNFSQYNCNATLTPFFRAPRSTAAAASVAADGCLSPASERKLGCPAPPRRLTAAPVPPRETPREDKAAYSPAPFSSLLPRPRPSPCPPPPNLFPSLSLEDPPSGSAKRLLKRRAGFPSARPLSSSPFKCPFSPCSPSPCPRQKTHHPPPSPPQIVAI